MTTRPFWQTAAMLLLLSSLVLLFAGLGIWQLQRMLWKQELIETVEARVHAEPTAIPTTNRWNDLDLEGLVYQPVQLTGTFDHRAEVQSLAVSSYGSGFWVMTPLTIDGGGTVLINRGFVPQSQRDPKSRPEPTQDKVTVTGLLRRSEPKGGFLRSNNPETGRWYSRDVAAIATAKNINAPVAPFFVDAFAKDNSSIDIHANAEAVIHRQEIPEYPLGGLTVVRFRDTHLSYALTWFALALLCMVGIVLLRRENRQATALL